ncbi:MAG TPA: hypothetical protein VGG34_15110 [Opitutaceae bacterium]|jgi:hypothetical protein
MRARTLRAVLVSAGLALMAGCGHISSRTLPGADLSSRKTVFVEHRLADSYGISDEIARQLRGMGYKASSGALTMMEPGTDLVVSYDDMWTWDFNNYMIEIDIQVRNATSGKVLAIGHDFRPSMVFGHAPEAMIHDVLVKLFRHA